MPDRGGSPTVQTRVRKFNKLGASLIETCTCGRKGGSYFTSAPLRSGYLNRGESWLLPKQELWRGPGRWRGGQESLFKGRLHMNYSDILHQDLGRQTGTPDGSGRNSQIATGRVVPLLEPVAEAGRGACSL